MNCKRNNYITHYKKKHKIFIIHQIVTSTMTSDRALKETQKSANPNEWPDLTLSSSTTGLLDNNSPILMPQILPNVSQ